MKYSDVFKTLEIDNIITNAIRNGNFFHAYLVLGKDANIIREYLFYIAKKILGKCDACDNCKSCVLVNSHSHPDLNIYPKEIGDTILTKDIEDIFEKAYLKPSIATEKVFIISGLENTSEICQNKLLKLIEEPPKFTHFLFSAKSPEKVLQTIRSRTVKLNFPIFSEDEICKFLINETKDSEKLKFVSKSCRGMVSEALKILKSDIYVNELIKAFNIISGLKTSRDVLSISAMFDHKNDKDILDFMQMIYRDMLAVKIGKADLVIASKLQSKIENLSKNYSSMTLIESVKLLNEAILRDEHYVGKVGNIDKLLLDLLEVRYNCQ